MQNPLLRDLRRKKRITLRKFAEILGISPSELCQIEIGYRPITQELQSKIEKEVGLFSVEEFDGDDPAPVKEFLPFPCSKKHMQFGQDLISKNFKTKRELYDYMFILEK